MSRIHKLDAQTANMIAAGEVVERPMGVVKELVENAIDAGARRIRVDVLAGGIQKITVTDDGCGMDSEDAVLAFERHATSKIAGQEDLWQIHTLGFRGEALPSIASVSKLTLSTSAGREGTRVRKEYGETVSAAPYACDQGTEISVEGLFYRTPARLKHLRSASYENSLIQDVVTRFALSHPEIAFVFTSDGKEAFRTSGQGNLLEVIYQAYGKEAAENAVKTEFHDFDYQVAGYLIKPNITRASRSFMHVFLNGRMVHTYRLYKAILDGYEDFIVKDRYPVAVLSVTMDPHLLDVNVHPSKWEVRLSKEMQLEYLIRDQVRAALRSTVLAPKAEIQEARQYAWQPLRMNTDDASLAAPASSASAEAARPLDLPQSAPAAQESLRIEENVPSYTPQSMMLSFPEMKVIGQLHDKYILCSCEKGLAVIDQHAAQERVHYEQISATLNKNPSMIDCLVPIVLHAGEDMVQRVQELNDAVRDLHVTFEPFGPDTLAVRRVPLWMKEIEEEKFLADVLDYFRDEKQSTYARMEKHKIATMACHHSIRFNHRLNPEEMQEVVNQLSRCENPYHCPHGRPTFVILDEKELTREFLR